MKQRVKDWIKNGELFSEALIIASEIALNPLFIKACRENKNMAPFIKSAIFTKLDIDNIGAWGIRDDFPFLNNADCPLELKALVTDKFSSFYKYKALHQHLFDCVTLEECAKLSAEILSNFEENRIIWKELEYYRDNKTVLGKHPVLEHYKEIKRIGELSIKDLIKLETKLNHNIWRIKSEIAKGDKPHLLAHRNESLMCKSRELNLVLNIINAHGNV